MDEQKFTPKGYLSESSKKSYTLTVAILAGVFFLGQILLPMIVMMAIMPGFMFGMLSMSMPAVEQGTYWDGELWFPSKGVRMGRQARASTELLSLGRGPEAELVKRADLASEDTQLLADDDRLWIISSESVSEFRDGRMELVHEKKLGSIGRPFLHEGRPALLETRPDGTLLKKFTPEGWVDLGVLDLGTEPGGHHHPPPVQVVSLDGALHCFMQIKDRLFTLKGVPLQEKKDPPKWQPVATVGWGWTAVALDGTLAVFSKTGRGFEERVVGRFLRNGSWKQEFTTEEFGVSGLAALSVDSPGRYLVALGRPPGAVKLHVVEAGKILETRRLGSGFPFDGKFMALMFIPHLAGMALPLVLVVIVSSLMRRHRVPEFSMGTTRVPYASMTRRGLARAIDGVIQAGPVFLVMLFLFQSFSDFPDPRAMFGFMGMMAVGVLWVFVWFAIFSFQEGRSGSTPGKRLLGIRVVGTDLEPCGFGRAFIRNLLLMADGFFNFTVGIVAIAFTDRWQRLGDLAAKTVVVRRMPERR